jgi:hypothetical protein
MLYLYYYYSVAIDNIASAYPHYVRHRSPALRPVFNQLARTGFFVEGGVLETPAHPKLFRESPPLW